MAFLNLLYLIYFEHKSLKQSIRELVAAEKKLFLVFQHKNKSLDFYTRNFKALLEPDKENEVQPG